MSFKIRCPKCHKVYVVAEKFRGKKAKCQCGNYFIIPQDLIPSSEHSNIHESRKNTNRKILNHVQDKNILIQKDHIVRIADREINKNHSHKYTQKQALFNKSRLKMLAICVSGFILFLSVAIVTLMLIPDGITVYGYQQMEQLYLCYPFIPSILQQYVKTDEKNMFLAIQVDVPIRYFIIKDFNHDIQELRKRWNNYIREHKSSYFHCKPTLKTKSTAFGDIINSSLEEQRGPILPWMDFIPLKDEVFAILDPQHFYISDSQERENKGCFIAIVNASKLQDAALMSFSSWEGKFEIKVSKGFIGFEQLISLAISEPFDHSDKITVAVVFHIPSGVDPLTYKVHFNGFRSSQIPQVKLEFQSKSQ